MGCHWFFFFLTWETNRNLRRFRHTVYNSNLTVLDRKRLQDKDRHKYLVWHGCVEFCTLGNLSHEGNFPDVSTLPLRESQERNPFCTRPWTSVSSLWGGVALSAASSHGLWLLSRAGFVLHPGSGPSCGWLDLSSRTCDKWLYTWSCHRGSLPVSPLSSDVTPCPTSQSFAGLTCTPCFLWFIFCPSSFSFWPSLLLSLCLF